ncbi:MAG: hypothetical protein LBN11_05050 [Tannerella sp.]|nr:hypothetical protein [Tannerella sp.]
MEIKMFMKTVSYRLIEQNVDDKYFTLHEQKQLYADVFSAFTRLIATTWASCPYLTGDDMVFCCLSKIGLETSVICCCMGIVNRMSAKQRKHRIKNKMNEEKCNDLFDSIFNFI